MTSNQKPIMVLDSNLRKGVFFKTIVASGSEVVPSPSPMPHSACHPDTWAELSQEDKALFHVRDADKIARELLEKPSN